MTKAKDCLRNNAAMTLVEILVSLVLLGLVLIAIFPLLTQSLQVTNLANRITGQLFADQEDIEIVAATNGGVLFSDGTFLTDKQFKVVFGASEPFDPETVVGLTIKKDKLIRYIASISHIKATYVYEGYTAAEAEIPITGIKTNFINTTKTVLTVTDRLGNDVSAQCQSGYEVLSMTQAKFTLPTEPGNRFTNELSPYTITMTTGNERASTLLPVYLPQAIAVDSNRNLVISSKGTDWIGKSTSSKIDKVINKIVFMSTSGESDARYVGVGKDGGIYLWFNQHPWEKINSPTDKDLNYIMYSGDKNLLLACGNAGVILTSPDGTHWTKHNSGTNMNLKAISYLTAASRFICVGDGGVILASANGSTWTRQDIDPLMAVAVDAINSKNAVRFSGAGDYLITKEAPATDPDHPTRRTIVMVACPQNILTSLPANLISWGSPLDKIAGGRFSFGIDDAGKLNVEQETTVGFSANLSPYLTSQPSIFICRSSSEYFEDYELLLNGESRQQPPGPASTLINTQNHFGVQLGSDPLTRYNGPYNFKGLIAEVLVFNYAVNDYRAPLDPPDPDKRYASELDLLRAYLSIKYGLNLDKLEGTEISNLFLPDGVTSLQYATEDQCRNAVTYNNKLVLWLDASDNDSLDPAIANGEQVLQWKDVAHKHNTFLAGKQNNAAGAALNAIACSSSKVVTGGYHRNLLCSSNANSWSQTNQLGSKRTTEYEVSDMLFCNDQFVALVNDGLSSFSAFNSSARQHGWIAYSKDGEDWTLLDMSSGNGYLANDMYYGMSAGTILVVGNHGSMFTSSDNGKTWNDLTSGSGTTNNLLAGCIR